MRWQLDWRMLLVVFAIFGFGLFLGSEYGAQSPPVEVAPQNGSGRFHHHRLRTSLSDGVRPDLFEYLPWAILRADQASPSRALDGT